MVFPFLGTKVKSTKKTMKKTTKKTMKRGYSIKEKKKKGEYSSLKMMQKAFYSLF